MDLTFAAAFSRGECLESPQKKKKAPRHPPTSDQQVAEGFLCRYHEKATLSQRGQGALLGGKAQGCLQSFCLVQARGNGYKQREALMEECEDEDWEMGGDLPTVDDLEVAALAAQAAMEAIDIKESRVLIERETSSSEVSVSIANT